MYIDSELTDNIILIPAHFLFGNMGSTKFQLPDVNTDAGDTEWSHQINSVDLVLDKWRHGQKLVNHFWHLWRNDYLLSLRERNFTHKQRASVDAVPQPGDVVTIKDQLPRSQWKMGKIDRVIKGKDGRIRSAFVRLTNRKLIQRPLKLIYPIEYSTEDSRCEDSVGVQDTGVQDRSERPTRAAARAAKELIKNCLRRECQSTHD